MGIIKAFIDKKEVMTKIQDLQKKATEIAKKEKKLKNKVVFDKSLEENKNVLNEKDTVFYKKPEENKPKK